MSTKPNRPGHKPREQAPPDPLLLDLARRKIDESARQFALDQNPMHAWKVYMLAHAYRPWGIDVPDWVASYLAGVGEALVAIERDFEADEDGSAKTLGPKLLKALGLGRQGRGSVFTRRLVAERDDALARHVALLVVHGGKEYIAIDDVADLHGVSRSTAQRAYYAAKADGEDLLTGGFVLPRAQFPAGLPNGSTIDIRGLRWLVEETLEQDDDVLRIHARLVAVTPQSGSGSNDSPS